MIRFLKTVLVACVLFSAFPCHQATAADGDKLGKGLKKEYKRTVKQMKSEGWTVNGVSQSIEQVMETHFLRLQEVGTGALVIEGNGKAKTVTPAVKKAMVSAMSQYTTMRESAVSGRTEIQVTNESSDQDSSHTSFNASYVSSSKQTVRDFRPTVVLYRKLDDGTYEARALYVFDEAN